MKKISIVVSMLLGLLLIDNRAIAIMCGSCGGEGHQHEEKAEKKTTGTKMEMKESFYSMIYVCPMHPEVKSDNPGKCPKCGMDLVPKNK